MEPSLRVKIATEPWELEEIYALGHRTFAEEIPRYEKVPTGRLVDRFHDQNTYVIALRGRRVAGMIAVRGARPFSLDERLPNLDSYLPPGRSICELRLLAVDRRDRTGRLLPALLAYVWRHCYREGYDLALISGITRQLKLYTHLGFVPFGPVVGAPGAEFQPMMLTLERFAPRAQELFRSVDAANRPVVNLLPGPVAVRDDVRRAFERPAESHRSPGFVADVEAIKARLCDLVGAARVELILGSGTAANDAVAAQLSLQRGSGLVLSNGEFGERLVDHARRFRLPFDVVRVAWGGVFDLAGVGRRFAGPAPPAWIWFVHCETSSGVLNDLDGLRILCAATGTKVCVDAISSIGAIPIDLAGTYLASAVSGKGLGAFPGLSMVFSNHDIAPAPHALPRYLDLGLYARAGGIPFTQSSNLVHALGAAVAGVDWPRRFEELAETTAWLRERLERLGFDVVAPADHAAPGLVTIALRAVVQANTIGEELERRGYAVSVNSGYLVERNWLQICLMGDTSREQLAGVTDALFDLCGNASFTAGAS